MNGFVFNLFIPGKGNLKDESLFEKAVENSILNPVVLVGNPRDGLNWAEVADGNEVDEIDVVLIVDGVGKGKVIFGIDWGATASFVVFFVRPSADTEEDGNTGVCVNRENPAAVVFDAFEFESGLSVWQATHLILSLSFMIKHVLHFHLFWLLNIPASGDSVVVFVVGSVIFYLCIEFVYHNRIL